MKKKILGIEHPHQHHMVGDGFRVSQYIPGYGREMSNNTSPFLMLDYNAPWEIKPQGNHRPGVGFHPHRGFETVTIVYSGEIEHQDTAGNGGIIGLDEVQWMTAGSGLLHNEFFTSEFSRNGGVAHFVQLWVNLPRVHKMTPPRYQALTRENIPEILFHGGKARVISGNFEGKSDDGVTVHKQGIAKTYSPVELYDIMFDEGGIFSLQFPPGFSLRILLISGEIHVDKTIMHSADMAIFSNEGEIVSLTGAKKSRVLVMAGLPLQEPVVNYGPFVMNTHEEIKEAFRDLKEGKMGTLLEE